VKEAVVVEEVKLKKPRKKPASKKTVESKTTRAAGKVSEKSQRRLKWNRSI